MRFHTQTAGVSLTAQQPLVNIVRTAIEALAGVLGGTQSLHTNSYDEALALPTEEAVRIALRTQQVIAHESGVTNTIDPLGGSYFVETLTDEMERAAYEYFARIDELGGMVEAIKQNFPQREIADASFRYQQEVDSKQRIVVGVNDYVNDGRRGDPDPEDRPGDGAQAGGTPGARPSPDRDSAAVERTLGELKAAAATDANLMPLFLDCARARVSEGEMVAALQEVFGTLHRVAGLLATRLRWRVVDDQDAVADRSHRSEPGEEHAADVDASGLRARQLAGGARGPGPRRPASPACCGPVENVVHASGLLRPRSSARWSTIGQP